MMKRLLLSSLGFGTLLVSGCDPNAGEPDFGVRDLGSCNFEGLGPADEFAYVINRGSGDVTIINPRRCEVEGTIELGGEPVKANASASGKYVYVANYTRNVVSIIDTDVNVVVDELAVIEAPEFVQFSSDHRVIWVFGDGEDVSLLDVKNNSIGGTVTVGAGAKSLTMNEDYPYKAYVALEEQAEIKVFDTSDYSVITTIPVGDTPRGIDFSDASNNAYVCTGNGVEVISTSGATSESVIKTITLSAPCSDITFDHTGRYGWIKLDGAHGMAIIDAQTDELVTEFGLDTGVDDLAFFRHTSQVVTVDHESSEATLLDADSYTTNTTFTVGAGTDNAAIRQRAMIESLDLRHAYILNPGENTMTIYDTLRREVRGTIPVGENAYYVVVAGPGGGSCCD